MRIKPFRAWRPPAALAAELASPPYDVLSVKEARELTRDNPRCFLHVTMPLVDLPPETPEKDEAVYQTARKNFDRFLKEGYLAGDAEPGLFLYRINMQEHIQRGLVAVSHAEDYEQGRIKKHEHTRPAPEEDRTRHIRALDAQAGPVFLTYRDLPAVDAIMAEVERAEKPLYDFVSSDGIAHTVWRIPQPDRLTALFAKLPETYIADGHHRAAASARAARELREANPHHTGEEEYNWFLTVLFPASQLNILPYNRCVADLNGMDAEGFLACLREAGIQPVPSGLEAPDAPGGACMYLAGQWYELEWTAAADADVVASMDVSILQDRILEPILGIDDPRRNARISFVGGIRGTGELRKRVDAGEAAVAFSVYPTTIGQLMAVADANRVMPPKSTWFEPKLRSGLLVHRLESEG